MAKSKTRKKYTPKPRHNPEWIARQNEKDRIEVKRLANFIKSYDKAYSNHITYLGNFARHDIKNAIQSIDSILSTTDPSEFTEDIVESLKNHLGLIRNTTDNFAKLIPYSTDGTFTLDTLLNASQVMFRADMVKHNIEIEYDYPVDCILHIKHPFQSLVQMINNLLINCIKALENTPEKKLLVRGEIDEDDFTISIYDNGEEISDESAEQIFDFGFSTTGGSGLGLFHAKYLCNEFKGSIYLERKLEDSVYNKVFIIKLPLREIDGEERTDN